MFGFLVFCVIVFLLYQRARKENAKNKQRKKKLFENGTQPVRSSGKNSNRALKSMREAEGDGQAVKKPKEMPIEARRKQQNEASDRSRIHQSLHKKEEQELQQRQEIRFEDGELMEEVYDIMACGYPLAKSGHRDFLKEGMEMMVTIP